MKTLSRKNPLSKVDVGFVTDIVFSVLFIIMSFLDAVPDAHANLIAVLAVLVLVVRLLKVTGETINEYIKIGN
jgi:hypothetical protein